MRFLCIRVNEDDEQLKAYLTEAVCSDSGIGMKCEIKDVANLEGSTSIICNIKEEYKEKEMYPNLYNQMIIVISGVLTNYIIDKYQEKLVLRIINSNYCYFNPIEKGEIKWLTYSIIKNEEGNFLNSLFQIKRRNIITKRLLEYFRCSNTLILEGFINFRIKDYVGELEEIVDKAVDDFLTEREYREFVRLLRYFVDIQEPKFNLVHIVVSYSGKYILLDENKNEITNEYLHEFMSDIPEGEINYDDLLVSSLITMAPRKIIIHGVKSFKNKELLETIKNVFWGKFMVCSKCELCPVNLAKSENKN